MSSSEDRRFRSEQVNSALGTSNAVFEGPRVSASYPMMEASSMSTIGW